MASAECPVGDCDYAGPVKSVEAHISGATAGDHLGKLGRNFREELVEQVEETINGGDGSEGSDDLLLGLSTGEVVVAMVVVAVLLWLISKNSATEHSPEEGGSATVEGDQEEDDQAPEPSFAGAA